MSNTAWLVVALAITAGALLGYVAWLAARRKRLTERLEQLPGTETPL